MLEIVQSRFDIFIFILYFAKNFYIFYADLKNKIIERKRQIENKYLNNFQLKIYDVISICEVTIIMWPFITEDSINIASYAMISNYYPMIIDRLWCYFTMRQLRKSLLWLVQSWGIINQKEAVASKRLNGAMSERHVSKRKNICT